jgi:transposase
VDDVALCCWQKIPTIIVDFKRDRTIDLLPDRSAETLAA